MPPANASAHPCGMHVQKETALQTWILENPTFGLSDGVSPLGVNVPSVAQKDFEERKEELGTERHGVQPTVCLRLLPPPEALSSVPGSARPWLALPAGLQPPLNFKAGGGVAGPGWAGFAAAGGCPVDTGPRRSQAGAGLFSLRGGGISPMEAAQPILARGQADYSWS